MKKDKSIICFCDKCIKKLSRRINLKETKKQREERKGLYIAKALSMNHGGADEKILIKQASANFEKNN